MELDKYKIEDSTHLLNCSHCVGQNCKYYTMKCIVLKEINNSRLKIVVFGERNWKGYENKKRIRYVFSSDVSIQKEES